jgi:hypothetical protein
VQAGNVRVIQYSPSKLEWGEAYAAYVPLWLPAMTPSCDGHSQWLSGLVRIFEAEGG